MGNMPNFSAPGRAAGDWFENCKREAQRLLKLPPSQLSPVLQDEMVNTDNWGGSGGTAPVQVLTKHSGVHNGNAGAGSTQIADTPTVNSTQPWYLAARFKYSAAVSGDVYCFSGLIDSVSFNNYILIGMSSATHGGSDTLYCVTLDNASTVVTTITGATVDTAYHDFRLVYEPVAATLNAYVDGGAAQSIATTQLVSDTMWSPAYGVKTGTNGHWDKFLVLTGLPT